MASHCNYGQTLSQGLVKSLDRITVLQNDKEEGLQAACLICSFESC